MRDKDITVLTFIALHIEQTGKPPTKQETARRNDLADTVVFRVFRKLQLKGLIVGLEHGSAANVMVTNKGHNLVRDRIEQTMDRWVA